LGEFIEKKRFSPSNLAQFKKNENFFAANDGFCRYAVPGFARLEKKFLSMIAFPKDFRLNRLKANNTPNLIGRNKKYETSKNYLSNVVVIRFSGKHFRPVRRKYFEI
jgi:hypothetical protein